MAAATPDGMRALVARFRETPETHVDRRAYQIVWEIVERIRLQLRQRPVAGDDPLAALQLLFTDLCCECAHGQRFAHPSMRDIVFKTLQGVQALREDVQRRVVRRSGQTRVP